MTDFHRLIAVLVEGAVEFIIIGGAAATAHGAAFPSIIYCDTGSGPAGFIKKF